MPHPLVHINAEIARIERTLLGVKSTTGGVDSEAAEDGAADLEAARRDSPEAQQALEAMAVEFLTEVVDRLKRFFLAFGEDQFDGIEFSFKRTMRTELRWSILMEKPGSWEEEIVLVGQMSARMKIGTEPELDLRLFGDIGALRFKIVDLNEYYDSDVDDRDPSGFILSRSGDKNITVSSSLPLDKENNVQWGGVFRVRVRESFQETRADDFPFDSKADFYDYWINQLLFAYEINSACDKRWTEQIDELTPEPGFGRHVRPKWEQRVGEKVWTWLEQQCLNEFMENMEADQMFEIMIDLRKMCADITAIMKVQSPTITHAQCEIKHCTNPVDDDIMRRLFKAPYIEGSDSFSLEDRKYHDAQVVLFTPRMWGGAAYALTELFPTKDATGVPSPYKLRFDMLMDPDYDEYVESTQNPHFHPIVYRNAALMEKLYDDHPSGSWVSLLRTYDEIMSMFSYTPPLCCANEFEFSGAGTLVYDVAYWMDIFKIFTQAKIVLKHDNTNISYPVAIRNENDLRASIQVGTTRQMHASVWRLHHVFHVEKRLHPSSLWIFYRAPQKGTNKTRGSFLIANYVNWLDPVP